MQLSLVCLGILPSAPSDRLCHRVRHVAATIGLLHHPRLNEPDGEKVARDQGGLGARLGCDIYGRQRREEQVPSCQAATEGPCSKEAPAKVVEALGKRLRRAW